MATNLETLELTIQSNAQSAKQGIDSLITSLSALPSAIKRSASELSKLNDQLSKLKRLATGIPDLKSKLPSFTNVTAPTTSATGKGRSGGGAAASGMPRVTVTQDQALGLVNNASRSDLTMMRAQGMMGSFVQNATQGNLTQQQLAEQAMRIQDVTDSYQRLRAAEMEQTTLLGQVKDGFKSVGESISRFVSKIGRVASTMVTRLALRAIINNFKEAWTAAYNFSKKMNGSFAANVDKVKNSLASMATNIVRAFAPLMSIIAPIFSVMATGIQYLANAIASLISMLGIACDLLGATADSISATSGASTSAAKEVVAGFDELNVINSTSSGGSGSGSGGSSFSTKFQEEIDAIKIIVAESLLAVGLILAFSGHVGVGLALAAVGAATIAGTIVSKWGTISKKVKGEITTIMAVAGASMMALGLILALSGVKTGLGIALIAAGAANLATAASLSWNLDDKVKKKISVIAAAVSGAFLAIGALLAFTGANIPLGIGLMVVGAATLATSIALSWNLDKKIKNIIAILTAVVGTAFLAIGACIAFTGANIPLGIALMAVGGAMMVSAASLTWDLDEDVKKKVTNVTTVVGGALLAVGAVLAFSGANIPLGLGLMAAGGVALASAVALNWDTLKTNIITAFYSIRTKLTEAWHKIQNAVTEAWGKFVEWKNAKWSQLQAGWTSIKNNLKTAWDTVKKRVSLAWDAVKTWIGAGWNKFQNGWNAIKNNLGGIWDGIKKSVSDAWDNVKEWINTGWTKFQTGWNTIKDNLASIWNNIGTAISGAWDNVKSWIDMGWGKLQAGWNAIKTNLLNIWNAIKAPIESAWDTVKNFWESLNLKGKIESAWNGVKDALTAIFKPIKDAWDWICKIFGGSSSSTNKSTTINVKTNVDDKTWTATRTFGSGGGGSHGFADGAYSIPKGQVFIANEQGAELIGQMDNHTAVANQQQIIEGIRRGVADGQSEQNSLLRRQNEILLGILQKDNTVRFGASSAFGRTVKRSLDMYNMATGV